MLIYKQAGLETGGPMARSVNSRNECTNVNGQQKGKHNDARMSSGEKSTDPPTHQPFQFFCAFRCSRSNCRATFHTVCPMARLLRPQAMCELQYAYSHNSGAVWETFAFISCVFLDGLSSFGGGFRGVLHLCLCQRDRGHSR